MKLRRYDLPGTPMVMSPEARVLAVESRYRMEAGHRHPVGGSIWVLDFSAMDGAKAIDLPIVDVLGQEMELEVGDVGSFLGSYWDRDCRRHFVFRRIAAAARASEAPPRTPAQSSEAPAPRCAATPTSASPSPQPRSSDCRTGSSSQAQSHAQGHREGAAPARPMESSGKPWSRP